MIIYPSDALTEVLGLLEMICKKMLQIDEHFVSLSHVCPTG